MALTAGTRLGPYIIDAPLGAGGMGEVYRARDPKLQREVAIKVLPELVASDPDRRDRFEREAQLLAAFNHPHIAQIYGIVDEANAPSAIVMVLVDGITLGDRIAQGPIALDEMLVIASQLVNAMDAAHSRGIIHRDLKPANIKLTRDGSVKVLDFGLAKMSGADGTSAIGSNAMNSPTFASPATAIGVILGTAAYMAPEQARGRPVDKRADVWAFGCIVFEMLTSERLFDGSDASDVLAAVLRAHIDWAKLPASVPPSIRRLLTRCLERDPNKRLRDIGDAQFELEIAAHEPAEQVLPHHGSRARTIVISAAFVALTALATGVAVWRLKPEPSIPLRKYDVLTDVKAESIDSESLSPDGAHIGYVAAGHLWVRDFDQIKPRDLGPVKDASRLVWSPDSSSLAYTSSEGVIRRVPLAGGASVVVCDIPESRRVMGLKWTGSDLVMAVWRGSLYRVDARGGTPKLWAQIDSKSEIDFHALTMLPDGRAVFATHRGNDQYTLESWDGEKRLPLLPTESIQYTAYSNGHLLFVRDKPNRGLWAIPIGTAALDPARAFLVEPSARAVSASNEGSLLIASSTDEAPSELTIFDRERNTTKRLGTPAPHLAEPSFSPDGRRVAFMRGSGIEKVELWVNDTAGGQGTRLTFGEQGDGADVERIRPPSAT